MTHRMSPLGLNFNLWSLGRVDAFSGFPYFKRTLELKKYSVTNQDDGHHLELIVLDDEETRIYVIANSFCTLFASKSEETAKAYYKELLSEHLAQSSLFKNTKETN